MSKKPEASLADTSHSGQPTENELQLLWVGSEGGMEADLVKREGLRFETIPAAGVHGVGWRAMPGNIWQLGRGYLASRRILRKFRPDVLFFTGGYVAVPMALAARFPKRLRTLLYIPDIEPGLALKTIARFSDYITLTVDESGAYFPRHNHKLVTGYPLRPELEHWTKKEARTFFALEESLPTLLVMGGSGGCDSSLTERDAGHSHHWEAGLATDRESQGQSNQR
jgi:UDP-N-acetylglucosamine--N-acetylmuramyl-(pentapeptide) pyrophosphoryl-undecaprenol N-acetylglucosamine transferase